MSDNLGFWLMFVAWLLMLGMYLRANRRAQRAEQALQDYLMNLFGGP